MKGAFIFDTIELPETIQCNNLEICVAYKMSDWVTFLSSVQTIKANRDYV